MKISILLNVVIALLALFFGLILGAKKILPESFYQINIYQVFHLLLTFIIGIVFAYFLNYRNSVLIKKRDYIIKQCSALDQYFEENAIKICRNFKDYSGQQERREILLFFKNISATTGIIKKLKLRECENGIDSIIRVFEEYKNKITGDDWDVSTSLNPNDISKFQKDIDSCKNILQNIIADCLNK